MNNITIIGNLTRDPELRYFESGNSVASFSIAWNEYKKGGEQEVHYFDCKAWGKTAETLANHCRKGSKVGLTGTLKQERWESKEGNKQSKVIINVDRLDLLGSKQDAETPTQQAATTSATSVDYDTMPF